MYLPSNLIMKRIAIIPIFLLLAIITGSFTGPQPSITGAWISKNGDDERMMICSGNYIMVAEFNEVNTAFYYAAGGSYKERDGMLVVDFEFSKYKEERENIGMKGGLKYIINGNKVTVLGNDSSKRVLTRVDDGAGALTGVWQLTGRLTNGKMEPVKGDLKTLKIVSGTRFQCVGFNTGTKEFVSCYGGRYSYKDGKYVEHIEFYWKDPDKIGTAVSFDASVDNNTWTNKKSGSKIEEWARGG